MAFPLIALLTAAASDAQQRSAYGSQVQKAGHDAENQILQTRARELGGSPYPMMAQSFQNSLGDMRRQADDSRNNQIGALLQAYLKSELSSAPSEKYGDPYESSFTNQKNLQYDPTGGIAMGDAVGKAQLDPWDKDPWGDAGF